MVRKKKKPVLPAGKRSCTSGRGTRISQQLLGKRKTNELGRLYGARQQATSNWRWVRTSAHELSSHGRTRCYGQPSIRIIRGRGNVQGSIGRARCPVSAKWVAQAHSRGFESIRTRCLIGDSQSSYIFGPLSRIPDGSTANAQVTNACLPPGECPNKTPFFISGVKETHSFLAWLRTSCPCGLMAQLKARI